MTRHEEFRRLLIEKGRAMWRDFEDCLWAEDPEPCLHLVLRRDLDGSFRCNACRAAVGFPAGAPSFTSTDPLRRWCVKHAEPWKDMDGHFSQCPTCMAEIYAKGSS